MSKKKQYDEFDDAPSAFQGEKIMSLLSLGGRGFAAGAIFAAIVLLALVLWIAYPSGDDATGEVPIIRADAGQYATQPDAPGGMDIPHRDSTVFSSMKEGNPDGKVENLLAENQAEAPMPKSDLFAGLNTTPENVPPQPQAEPMKEPVASQDDLVPVFESPSGNANAAKDEIQEVAPAKKEVTASAEPQPITTPADTAKTQAPVVEAEAAPEVAKAEPAAGATAPKAIADGTHFIQLASITDKAKADAAYKDLQKKYSSLSGVAYRVETADLGAKGTFYRIQAGPMAKADAQSACAAIKSASGSCLLVTK